MSGAVAEVSIVCPQCGGPFVLDVQQDPKRLIDRLKRNSDIPQVAMRKAEEITEKVGEKGLLYRCDSCDYRTRMVPPSAPAQRREPTAGAVHGAAQRRGLPAASDTESATTAGKGAAATVDK